MWKAYRARSQFYRMLLQMRELDTYIGVQREKKEGKEMKINDIPMSKVIKVRYETEEERERILKALEVLNTLVKTLKHTG